MKRFFVTLLIIVLSQISAISAVLQGGVSKSVPQGFFGVWKVAAVLESTTNPSMFSPATNEVWNLLRDGNVLTLTNPVSGAVASITVTESGSDTFTFVRKTGDGDENVIETVKLNLKDDKFLGLDTMVVRTYKNGAKIREVKARYKLAAVKIGSEKDARLFMQTFAY